MNQSHKMPQFDNYSINYFHSIAKSKENPESLAFIPIHEVLPSLA